MGNPWENPIKQEKRQSFDEVSEAEKIERFKNLKLLFSGKDKQEHGSEEAKRANYMDFFENMYKYPDRFKMEGKSTEDISKTFNMALGGNKIIKNSLDFYLAVRKNQHVAGSSLDKKLIKASRQNMQSVQSSLERTIDYGNYSFADSKSYQLNVDKLKNLFRWSLNSFIDGGAKIGREPGVKKEEIEPLCEDLEAILKHVNSYR